MSSEPDLIARREAVARLRGIVTASRQTWGYPATLDKEDIDDLDAILAAVEASDADTVRLSTALRRCERAAEMQVEQCLQRSDGRGLGDAKKTHRAIVEIVQETLTASHPKPEPVETHGGD